jgi:hypothetical protein
MKQRAFVALPIAVWRAWLFHRITLGKAAG